MFKRSNPKGHFQGHSDLKFWQSTMTLCCPVQTLIFFYILVWMVVGHIACNFNIACNFKHIQGTVFIFGLPCHLDLVTAEDPGGHVASWTH